MLVAIAKNEQEKELKLIIEYLEETRQGDVHIYNARLTIKHENLMERRLVQALGSIEIEMLISSAFPISFCH